MTPLEAVIAIGTDNYDRRRKPVDYRRICRALDVLGIVGDDRTKALRAFEYVDADGNPYPWTQDK